MSATLAYTDGSSIGNPGPSGWAVLINDNLHSGSVKLSTNNVMELLAIYYAVAMCNTKILTVVTDSVLCVRLINGKATARKEAIFETLRLVFETVKEKDMVLQAVWVKGHAKTEGNLVVDRAARECAEFAKRL